MTRRRFGVLTGGGSASGFGAESISTVLYLKADTVPGSGVTEGVDRSRLHVRFELLTQCLFSGVLR